MNNPHSINTDESLTQLSTEQLRSITEEAVLSQACFNFRCGPGGWNRWFGISMAAASLGGLFGCNPAEVSRSAPAADQDTKTQQQMVLLAQDSPLLAPPDPVLAPEHALLSIQHGVLIKQAEYIRIATNQNGTLFYEPQNLHKANLLLVSPGARANIPDIAAAVNSKQPAGTAADGASLYAVTFPLSLLTEDYKQLIADGINARLKIQDETEKVRPANFYLADYSQIRFWWREGAQTPQERRLIGNWAASDSGTLPEHPRMSVANSDGKQSAETITVQFVGTDQELAALCDSAHVDISLLYPPWTVLDNAAESLASQELAVQFFSPAPPVPNQIIATPIPVHIERGVRVAGEDSDIDSGGDRYVEFYCRTENLRMEDNTPKITFVYGLKELGGNITNVQCKGDFAIPVPPGRKVVSLGNGRNHANWHYTHQGGQSGWCGPEGADLGCNGGFAGSYVINPFPKGDGPGDDDQGNVRIDCELLVPIEVTPDGAPSPMVQVR